MKRGHGKQRISNSFSISGWPYLFLHFLRILRIQKDSFVYSQTIYHFSSGNSNKSRILYMLVEFSFYRICTLHIWLPTYLLSTHVNALILLLVCQHYWYTVNWGKYYQYRPGYYTCVPMLFWLRWNIKQSGIYFSSCSNTIIPIVDLPVQLFSIYLYLYSWK